jgi:ATPase subunit of ABC transporter with duplicated ATPase domains
MIEMAVKKLKKSFGADLIFENIEFDIQSGEKIGLVGKNGTGKTTLFKIIMGIENGEGEVFKRKDAAVGYLEQIPIYDENTMAGDVLAEAFKDINTVRKKMTDCEMRMGLTSENQDHVLEEYGKLQIEYERLGGYDLEEKSSRVIEGMNIRSLLDRSFYDLSGGEQTRVMLGRMLLMEPDILLLDEPTNHLDLKSVEWLEGYLRDYKGAALLISHDRYFLDNTVSKIIEMRRDGSDTFYGNYSYYVVEKERRFYEALKWYNNQQKKIKRMEDQIHRFRVWGDMRDSEKMYKKAKELEKRLEKMDELDRPVLDKKKINLGGLKGGRTGKIAVEAMDLSKFYDGVELFSKAGFEAYFGDSFALLGDNGTGKTTLLRILMGEVEANEGKTSLGSRVKTGYLPQKIEFENPQLSILDYFTGNLGLTVSESRKELAKILFYGEDVFRKISMLSGGEKSRLKLSYILHENANLLFLDEPTNHLDIDSREILEDTLLEFEGTIIFVSHDRYFINKLATRVGELRSKRLKIYNGDYEYFKTMKEREIEQERDLLERKKVKSTVKEWKVRSKNILKSLDKKKNALEDEIQKMEDEIEELSRAMDENPSNYTLLGKLHEDREVLEEKCIEKYMEFEEITIEIEEEKERDNEN